MGGTLTEQRRVKEEGIRSVKIVSFNHDKKTQIKNVDIKAEKEGKREKDKKR